MGAYHQQLSGPLAESRDHIPVSAALNGEYLFRYAGALCFQPSLDPCGNLVQPFWVKIVPGGRLGQRPDVGFKAFGVNGGDHQCVSGKQHGLDQIEHRQHKESCRE